MSRFTTPRSPFLLLVTFSALGSVSFTTGCSGDEAVKPVGGSSSGAGGATPTPTGTATTKRTISQRNPFGNVAESKNLLFDGDFEWSSPFSDQYGWFEGQNPTVSDVRIGAECKSGIKCVHLKKQTTLIGIGVASRDAPLYASVWVRFDDPATACNKANVLVLGGSETGGIGGDEDDAKLEAPEAPDASGWCKIEGVTPVRKNKAYLYIQNVSPSGMWVDDAVMKETTAPPVNLTPAPKPAIDPRLARDLDEARATVRQLDRPRDPPPNSTQKAFESHHQKDGL